MALTSALLGLPPAEVPAAPSKAPAARSKAPGGGSKEPSAALRRILVCAQSNAAVDELTLRLSKGILDKDTGEERYCLLAHCHIKAPYC